jgi:hypothetical protein
MKHCVVRVFAAQPSVLLYHRAGNADAIVFFHGLDGAAYVRPRTDGAGVQF